KFYEPDCGTIKLDGVDLREYDTHFLRDNIGLVLQKNHIFDGTIEENIIYALKNGRVEQSGNPDDVYRQGGVYKDIVDASARSLNIEKLAQTLDTDGDGKMFD
ncbi:MAG: ATP-binding cassette domain-containing protein, partial [Bacteroidales bacterium]|nr:ATP-binding cassette domain-containing protein [Bacteroidales bacterium]